jgi:hypothetical protein
MKWPRTPLRTVGCWIPVPYHTNRLLVLLLEKSKPGRNMSITGADPARAQHARVTGVLYWPCTPPSELSLLHMTPLRFGKEKQNAAETAPHHRNANHAMCPCRKLLSQTGYNSPLPAWANSFTS